MLMTPYAMGGWYAEALASLGCPLDEALSHLDTLHLNAIASVGFICSALGRGRDAREALTTGRAFWEGREDWSFVAVFCVYLLHEAYTPYFADDLAERAHLVATIEALPRHAARGGEPPPARVLWSLLVLEGRWTEARTLWEEETRVPSSGFTPHPRSASSPVHWETGSGRGGSCTTSSPTAPPANRAGALPTDDATQRLAAQLALDDGDLPTAQEWLEAHDRWLAWSGAVLGQSEGQRCGRNIIRGGRYDAGM